MNLTNEEISKIIKAQKTQINLLLKAVKRDAQEQAKAKADDDLADDVNQQIRTDFVNENAPDETIEDKIVADAFEPGSQKDVETQEGEVDLKAVAEELTEQTPTSL